MTKYVALLRGIGPLNPNMKNDRLRGVVEELGFTNVSTVISSGNVVFESEETDKKKLQALLESAWPEKLGFKSTTIVYSQEELEWLAAQQPFGAIEDVPTSRLNVTFLQHIPHKLPELPYEGKDKNYTVIGLYGRALCSVVDSTSHKTPDIMAWAEKNFGKTITTRTWKTVQRILKKMR